MTLKLILIFVRKGIHFELSVSIKLKNQKFNLLIEKVTMQEN